MKPFIKTTDIDSLKNRNPEVIHRLVGFFKPLFWHYFRPTIKGLDQIPEGTGMFVANHNGALLMPDLFIFGIALYERYGIDGLPYGMGHETGIGFPILHRLFLPIGGVRGSPRNARLLLAAGEKLLVYPGGELDSMRSFRKRTRIIFGKRRGYLQIALRERIPIIPVVSSGGHETLLILHEGKWLARALHLDRLLSLKTWPIVFCLPWGLWFGVPPPHFPFRTRIHIEVLEPIRFERDGPEAASDSAYVEACHRQVHAKMETTLKQLAAARRRRRKR
jgi:1-acyl-sn-glycerol-3-phosphate acyltransferase